MLNSNLLLKLRFSAVYKVGRVCAAGWAAYAIPCMAVEVKSPQTADGPDS